MSKLKWQVEVDKKVEKMSLDHAKSFYGQALRSINGDIPTEYIGYIYCALKKKLGI